MMQKKMFGYGFFWWLFSAFGFTVTMPWLLLQLIRIIRFKKKKEALKGKVVMITGASSGLGEALAHVFYKAGCKLILVSRRMQQLQRVKDDLLHLPQNSETNVPEIFYLDLKEINQIPNKITEILQVHNRIDILINNAGISYRGEVLNTSIDVDTNLMLTNYFGQIALTKAVLPSMIEYKSGHIICIGSIQSKVALPHRSAYSASKHAFQSWCDSARAELAKYNICLTNVCPGYIKTSLSMNAITETGQNYGVMDDTTKNGYLPEYVANKIFRSLLNGDKEIIIGSIAQKVAILLRVLLPNIYFFIMQIRANDFKKSK